ncbi:MAG: hypothetical protein IK083_01710 [Abditibacteriota bacterium]|nr:hypothetical protein [Abditibacteriota bacterium]
MLIFAHRGDSGNFPENTLPSYRSASEMAPDYVEADVRLSADGQVVISHDNNLKRTGRTDRSISDMTLEEIRDIDVSFRDKFGDKYSPCRVPTAREALSLFAEYGQKSILELKDPEAAPQLKRIMDEVGYAEKGNIIEVWSLKDAEYAQKYFTRAFFYFVSTNFDEYSACPDKAEYFAALRRAGISGWAFKYAKLSDIDRDEFIYLARIYRITLLAWNLDDENTVREALSLSVRRNGITARIGAISSNFPAMLLRVRAEMPLS